MCIMEAPVICWELELTDIKHKTTATNNAKSKCASKSIILNGDYAYSVVENFPCDTIQELRTRERVVELKILLVLTKRYLQEP
jgi:hypothetical protein